MEKGAAKAIAQSVTTLSYGHQASTFVGFAESVAYANTGGSKWAEVTVGWSFATASGLSVSVGPAVERLGNEYHGRARLNAYYDNEESHSFLYGQLDGGWGSSWYWVDGAYFILPSIGIGALAQMPDLGIGPKVEVRMGDHFSIWAAGLRQPTDKVDYLVIGGRLKFDK